MDPVTASILSSIGLSGGGAIGSYFGKKRRKKKRRRELDAIRGAGGIANYHPEYGAALAGMGDQTEGPGALYSGFLQNYVGTPDQVDIALRRMAPFTAMSLGNTAAMRHMQNFQNFDYVQPQEVMQGYGAAAGGLASAGGQAVQMGQQNLARAGLGRSAAMGAMAGQVASNVGGQQADLYTRMYQQALQQRMMNTQLQAQFAGQSFDMQRQMAQLALGMTPEPRTQQKDSLWGPIAQVGGSALGKFLEMLGGGGAGAGGGGGGGGGYGNLKGWFDD